MKIIKKFDYKYPEPSYIEEFRLITYPGIKPFKYLISNHGRVFNNDKKIFMKTYFDDDFHEKITLVTDIKHPTKRGNKSKHYFIHRLMCWEFIGPPPDEYHNIVNHKNGIPCCNFIHNLEWCSVLENTNHAKNKGLMKTSGLNSSNSKYDEKIIRRICMLFEEGYNNIDIFEIITGKTDYKSNSKNIGIYQLINKLGKRIIYRDIVDDYNYLPSKTYFECTEEIKQMRNLIMDNKTNLEIMKEFGYNQISDNRRFYNRIIAERVKCNVLFNDYRKHSL